MRQIPYLKEIPKRLKKQVFSSYRQSLMPTPNYVVVAGWEATGSTFIAQVLRLFGLQVKKIHGKWPNERLERVIFSIRDPRDIICSHARRVYPDICSESVCTEALLKSLDDFLRSCYIEDLFESLSQPNVIIVRYETYFGQSESLLVQMLADQFMIPLNKSRLTSILAETSLTKNQKRADLLNNFREYDPDSLIHGLHITNKGEIGAWKKLFSPAVEEMVKQKLGDILIQLGYESDMNWSIK